VWLGGFLLLAGLCAAAFLGLGEWLRNEDPLERADAIVVLGGDYSRAFHGADLFLQGYAPLVCVICPRVPSRERLLEDLGIPHPREAEIYRDILLKKGVPGAVVALLGESLVSTVDEAEAAARRFPAGSRILVVTSPYHVRRAKMVFRDHLEGRDVRVVGSAYEPYPSRWWTDKEAAGNVLLELHKILFYAGGGRFRSGPGNGDP